GAFTSATPWRAARPDLGSTSPAMPAGISTATPVGTEARSPGPSVTGSRACRSRPASCGYAREGSLAAGSSRRTRWLTLCGSHARGQSEGREPRGHRRRQPHVDEDALRRVLPLQIAGDLVELGEPAALLVWQQQLDIVQRARKLVGDPVGQRLEPLAGQR